MFKRNSTIDFKQEMKTEIINSGRVLHSPVVTGSHKKIDPNLKRQAEPIAVASSDLSRIANTWPELLISGNANIEDFAKQYH